MVIPLIVLATPCPPWYLVKAAVELEPDDKTAGIVVTDPGLFASEQSFNLANSFNVSATDDRINPVLNSSPPLAGITVSAEPCKERYGIGLVCSVIVFWFKFPAPDVEGEDINWVALATTPSNPYPLFTAILLV